MPDWIVRYWGQWLCGITAAILAAVYKRLSGKLKKHMREEEALRQGLLAILHDRLYGRCTECLEAGKITTQALQNLDCVYSAYHALGGNGTGTQLYKRVQTLPIRSEREDQS